MKKLCMLFLSILMFVSSMQPSIIFALDEEEGTNDPVVEEVVQVEEEIFQEVPQEETVSIIDSGSAGDNITWTLYSDGLLEFTGSGVLDYDVSDAPWEEHKMSIIFIVMDDRITKVPNKAFFEYTNLERITLSRALSHLPDSMFEKCISLESVEIPNGVVSIGNSAFEMCGRLSSVIMPTSLVSIGDYAFRECLFLEYFDFSNVTDIGKYSFAKSGLIDIIIPSKLTTIASYAFYDSYLESVIFEEGVETIKDNAFSNCKKLKSVTLPKSLSSIGSSCFEECIKLKSIEIFDKITTISSSAFYGCDSLLDIKLPNTLITIERYAFSGIYNYVNERIIYIPSSVKYIDTTAFGGTNIIDVSDNQYALQWAQKNNVQYYLRANSICFTNEFEHVHVGSSTTLKPVCVPEGTNYIPGMTWEIGDPTIATVNNNGTVTGINTGITTISCRGENGLFASTSLIVTKEPNSFDINCRDKILTIDNTYQLKATVYPESEYENSLISWYSEDESIATVDDNGLVTGVGVGVTNIVAKACNGKTIKCKFTVKHKVKEIKIPCTEIEVIPFADIPFPVEIVSESSFTPFELNIISDDPNIATVGHNGTWQGFKIHSYRPGTTDVTFSTQDGTTAKCTITVLPYVKKAYFDKPNITAKVGDEITLSLVLEYQNPDFTVISNPDWSFSNNDMVIARSIGPREIIFEATKPGVLIVEAKDEYLNINVKSEIIIESTISKFDLKYDEMVCNPNINYHLHYSLEAESHYDESTSSIIWTSSNPDVAYVDEFTSLKTLSLGETVITGTTNNGLSDSMLVRVIDGFVQSDFNNVLQSFEIADFQNEFNSGQKFTVNMNFLPAFYLDKTVELVYEINDGEIFTMEVEDTLDIKDYFRYYSSTGFKFLALRISFVNNERNKVEYYSKYNKDELLDMNPYFDDINNKYTSVFAFESDYSFRFVNAEIDSTAPSLQDFKVKQENNKLHLSFNADDEQAGIDYLLLDFALENDNESDNPEMFSIKIDINEHEIEYNEILNLLFYDVYQHTEGKYLLQKISIADKVGNAYFTFDEEFVFNLSENDNTGKGFISEGVLASLLLKNFKESCNSDAVFEIIYELSEEAKEYQDVNISFQFKINENRRHGISANDFLYIDSDWKYYTEKVEFLAIEVSYYIDDIYHNEYYSPYSYNECKKLFSSKLEKSDYHHIDCDFSVTLLDSNVDITAPNVSNIVVKQDLEHIIVKFSSDENQSGIYDLVLNFVNVSNNSTFSVNAYLSEANGENYVFDVYKTEEFYKTNSTYYHGTYRLKSIDVYDLVYNKNTINYSDEFILEVNDDNNVYKKLTSEDLILETYYIDNKVHFRKDGNICEYAGEVDVYYMDSSGNKQWLDSLVVNDSKYKNSKVGDYLYKTTFNIVGNNGEIINSIDITIPVVVEKAVGTIVQPKHEIEFIRSYDDYKENGFLFEKGGVPFAVKLDNGKVIVDYFKKGPWGATGGDIVDDMAYISEGGRVLYPAKYRLSKKDKGYIDLKFRYILIDNDGNIVDYEGNPLVKLTDRILQQFESAYAGLGLFALEGTIPSYSVLKASVVKQIDGFADTNYIAYELELIANNEVVQPLGEVELNVSLPDALQDKDVVVYRINEDKSLVEMEQSTATRSDKVSFKTDYISTFVIVDKQNLAELEEIAFNPSEVTINEGASLQLQPTTKPENTIHGRNLTWVSSDENIVVVDNKGNIKGITPGSATITATAENGLSAICAVTVKEYRPITKLEISDTNLVMHPNTSHELVVNITPTNTTEDTTITWTSSNSKIASVSEDGIVQAHSYGTVTIKVTASNGMSVSCKVNVTVDKATTKVARASDTSLKVSWNKVNGATGYEVYRSTTIDGTYKKVTTITKGTTVSWTNTKLTNSTTYFYKVRPYMTVSGKKYYGEYSDVVGYAALKTPSVTAKRTGFESITLTWKTIKGADSYEIYRSTDNKNYELLTTTSAFSYFDNGLLTAKTYYYKVRAVKDCTTGNAKSSYSSVQSAKTSLSTPKATVTNPAFNRNELSWETIDGVDTYEVYRATKEKGTYKLIGETNLAYYADQNVTIGKTYYYKVRGYHNNEDGTKGYSSYSKIVSKKVAIATPKVTVTNPNCMKNELEWQDVELAKGYQVYRATKKDGKYSKVATVETSSYEDTDVVIGKTYYYKVRTVVDNNGTDTTGSYSSVVSKKVVIATPKLTVTNPDYLKNELDWQDVALAKEYEVHRATSKSGKYTKVATVTSSDYEDTNVVVGKTYYYKVRAVVDVNGKDTNSSYSSVVSKKVVIATPKLTVTNPNYLQNELDWQDVALAKEYQVYRSTKEKGTYTLVDTVTEPLYEDVDVVLGKTYYYKVRAVIEHTDGTTKYSSYSSIVSKKVALPKPTNVVVTRVDSKTAEITFESVYGAEGYEIYRATSKSGTYTKVATTTDTNYTNTKLSSSKTYYYKVRAYRTVNGKKVYSSYSSVITCKK